MKKQNSESKMAVMPVKKLMLVMGIPMIISMMLQALYNIVDSAFVSNMKENGETALNALTLAFPVQMLMVAIGIGSGVGVNALLSKSLGQGDKEKADKIVGNAYFLGIVIYILFVLFGVFGVEAYINTQTDTTIVHDMAVKYLKICCIVSPGIVFFSFFEKMLQATGRSHLSTIAQVAGAVTNIILDPILIYGLCGMPKLGVAGAAWATVIGQIVSCVCGLVFHLKYNTEITNKISYIRPDGKIIKSIYSIGLPAIISQALMSIMTYGMNMILKKIGENVVTAYGLYYKVQQFVLFAAFGLRDAITPVVSYGHGMRNRKRVTDGIKYGMIYTFIIMLAGTAIIEAVAAPLAGMFGLSGQTEYMCIGAMRLISLSFVFAGGNVAFQGVFQALDAGVQSLVISICRQILFVLPPAWGFAGMAAGNNDKIWVVWFTFIIAEVMSFIIAALFMRKIYKRKIKTM